MSGQEITTHPKRVVIMVERHGVHGADQITCTLMLGLGLHVDFDWKDRGSSNLRKTRGRGSREETP